MRKLIFILAVMLLAACHKPPCDCDCPPQVQQRLESQYQKFQLMGAMKGFDTSNASRKVITCTAPDNCVIDVPVTESADKTACQAPLPYCVVCIRKGTPPANPASSAGSVTWRLTVDGKATDKFAFSANQGINIFHAGATGKDDFRDPGYGAKPNEFKWDLGADHSDVLAHGAEVYRLSDEKRCDPVDPVIVNTD